MVRALLRSTLALTSAGCALVAGLGQEYGAPGAADDAGAPPPGEAGATPDAPAVQNDALPSADAPAEASSIGCTAKHGSPMVRMPASSLCVDAYEASRADYQAFLDSSPSVLGQSVVCAWNTDFSVPAKDDDNNDCDFDGSKKPVVCVDWCDAAAYCAWAGKRLCHGFGGLALNASQGATATSEWHFACSKGGAQNYPYGSDFVQGLCADGSKGNTLEEIDLSPQCQGGFKGLYDMVGNVREWIDACDAAGTPDQVDCARMGGSTADSPSDSACSTSETSEPRSHRGNRSGFRCCADAR